MVVSMKVEDHSDLRSSRNCVDDLGASCVELKRRSWDGPQHWPRVEPVDHLAGFGVFQIFGLF